MNLKNTVVLVAALLTAPSSRGDFYVNTKGPQTPYSIARFLDDGQPASVGPAILPSGSGFDAKRIAWPSAVQVGAEIYVYAAGYDGSKWEAVGLWKSTSDRFTRVGAVLTADDEEGQITTPHVVYDRSDEAVPFKMWYGAVIVGGLAVEVRYATSINGLEWTKYGTVLTAGASYDAVGFAPDYVCRANDGTWHMFYTALARTSASVAALATAPAAGGPWTKQGPIMSNDGIGVAVTATPIVGTSILSVADATDIRVGRAYMLTTGQNAKSQLVTVAHKIGNNVFTVQPIWIDLAGASPQLVSIARNKISPSYAWQDADGEWFGIFTGFSPSTIDAEYAFKVKKVGGAWVVDESVPAPVFAPSQLFNLYSTENPEPVRASPDCARR